MNSHQKKAQGSSSLETLYPFFNSLQEFICIISEEEKFEFVNQSLSTFLEISLTKIKTLTVRDLFPLLDNGFKQPHSQIELIHPKTKKKYSFVLNFSYEQDGKTLFKFTMSPFLSELKEISNSTENSLFHVNGRKTKKTQNEDQLTFLLRTLPGMVYRCKNDPNWTMVFVSEGCYDLTGYKPEDLIENNKIAYNDLIHPQDQIKIWDEIQEAIQENKKFEFVYRIFTADQQEKWVWERGQAAYDNHQQSIVLEGFITDITDRIRSEMEAKKAQQQADALREALTEITTQLSLAEVLRKILDSLKKVLSYDSATLFLKLDGEIKIVAARGFENTGLLINRTFPSNHKLILAIDEVRKPLIIKDASQDPRFEKWDIKEHSRSWMGIPLIRNHITIGYLTLDNNQPDIYTEEDANTAQLFANGAAIVIENAKLYEKSQQLATSDALTSIFNRRHFYELALTEFERSKRYKAHLSVIMLDIDHFKYINDKYGHLTGDQILISFVQRVQAELRTSDVFARYGGEEFIILLPETDNRQAIQVAERLRVVTAEKPFTNNQTSPYITISLGVATLDDSCDNLDTLIDRSDKALYEAKQIGRNRVRSWNH
jgi:diguanylate cyclase (GGDEF)-like protein/PAS domain S-box-containing protein